MATTKKNFKSDKKAIKIAINCTNKIARNQFILMATRMYQPKY